MQQALHFNKTAIQLSVISLIEFTMVQTLMFKPWFADPNTVFFEFPNPIGKSLAWLHIQVRVLDNDGLTWVTEGIGKTLEGHK